MICCKLDPFNPLYFFLESPSLLFLLELELLLSSYSLSSLEDDEDDDDDDDEDDVLLPELELLLLI